METHASPSLSEIRACAASLAGRIARTPVLDWAAPELVERLAPSTTVNLKLELFQQTGSFKARGALAVIDSLSAEKLAGGVTAVSAGNHAIAVAWAARAKGVHAKVVMTATASPIRVEKVKRYGGEVVLAPDVQAAFALVREIEQQEGRAFIHPYEGPVTARGTATIGLEWLEQAGSLDAVIVPIGGGGLMAGISAAIKQASPATLVLGVEPLGADSMSKSLAAGSPQAIDRVATVADSLGAPFALPYSFALCQRHVDEVLRISDAAMVDAMRLYLDTVKLMLEPAGASALAALMGPYRERLAGKRVGVLVCGSNIDPAGFQRLITAG